MNGIEITHENMDAAEASIPKNTPFVMLNLLRFKDQASYGPDEDFEPSSGREAYFKRYIPAFMELSASKLEIQPFFLGKVLAGLVLGEDEDWEICALISYPDFQSFKAIVVSEAYKLKALPHRLAALADLRLMAAVEADLE